MSSGKNFGKPLGISEIKIKSIYKIARLNKFLPIIAKTLETPHVTLTSWLKKADELLEEHEVLREMLGDSYLYNKCMTEECYADTESFKEKFIEETGTTTENKYFYKKFEEWITNQKIEFFEKLNEESETKLINSFIFSEHEQENDKCRRYIRFYRSWKRGLLSITNQFQEAIDHQSINNSRNIAMAHQNLKLMESDSYTEKQTVKHEHSHLIAIDVAKQWHSQVEQHKQGLIEQKKDEVVEAEFEKVTEENSDVPDSEESA